MNKEEIIDCLKTTGLNEEFVVEFYEEMELFAKLVTQKEREACAELIPPQYFHFRDWIRARGQK